MFVHKHSECEWVCACLDIPLHESSWYSSSVIQKKKDGLWFPSSTGGLGCWFHWREMSYKTLISRILGNIFISYIKGVITSFFFFFYKCKFFVSRIKHSYNLLMTIFYLLSDMLNLSSHFAAVSLGFLCMPPLFLWKEYQRLLVCWGFVVSIFQ